MLFLQIAILVALLIIFIQDILYRSVYWILFPLLIILFIALRVSYQSGVEIWQSSLVNTGFLVLQLLLVSAYFSIKDRQITNIMDKLLGWGDVLFLASIAFCLSVLNFLLFYSVSLLMVLFFWLIWQLLVKVKNRRIPLAGLQALIFMLVLIGGWWHTHIDFTSDDWLLKFVAK